MRIRFPSKCLAAVLLGATAAAAAPDGAARLRRHVEALASAPRNAFDITGLPVGPKGASLDFAPNLVRASAYIAATLRGYGLNPVVASYPLATLGDIRTKWGLKARLAKVDNIEVVFPARSGGVPGEILVVGAHYDSSILSSGFEPTPQKIVYNPGADDNATAVAGLLELARDLRGKSLNREVRLAFFANEEPPFSNTVDEGSNHYAKALTGYAAAHSEKVIGMIALEGLGKWSRRDGTQLFLESVAKAVVPSPLLPGVRLVDKVMKLCYGGEGDFLIFSGYISYFSATSGLRLLEAAKSSYRRGSDVRIIALDKPVLDNYIGQNVSWSDNLTFNLFGVPAIMIGDTAPARYPFHYHSAEDTVADIDFDAMSRAVDGLAPMIVGLADDGLGGRAR